MKFTRADLVILRAPLLALLVAAVVSALLLTQSARYGESLKQQMNSAERNLRAAQSELSKVRQQEDNFRSFAETYARLQQRGLVGQERRLDWIDLAQKLRAQHQLISLDYDIAPQRSFTHSSATLHTLAARASAVELSMSALHEGDLLAFLHGLQANAPGAFRQSRCSLTRVNAGDTQSLAARVDARCTLDWLTLKTSG